MTTRTRISLDGAWDFQLDPNDGADIAAIQEWRTAQALLPWQAQFDDLRLINGVAWYRRHFTYTPTAVTPVSPFCTSAPSIISQRSGSMVGSWAITKAVTWPLSST